MKKSIIAGAGVAALAMAALPFAGVFADNVTPVTQAQDTVTVNVDKGCAIVADRTNTAATFADMKPGSTAEASTDPIQITCNSAWKLSVSATDLKNTTANKTIAASITGGLNGTATEWALQLTADPTTGNTINKNDFATFEAIGSSHEVTGNAGVTDLKLTPTYKVSLAPGQDAGEYTSTVTYNVAATN